jgi:hypothetical protein
MIDPLIKFREFIDHPLGNFRQQVYLPPPPSRKFKKKFKPLGKLQKNVDLQKFSFHNPPWKFQLGTPQKFRISDPLQKI